MKHDTIHTCSVVSFLILAAALIIGLSAAMIGSHTASVYAVLTAVAGVSVYFSGYWWSALQ